MLTIVRHSAAKFLGLEIRVSYEPMVDNLMVIRIDWHKTVCVFKWKWLKIRLSEWF